MTRLLSLALLALVALALAWLWRQTPVLTLRITWPLPDMASHADSSSADPLP